MVSKKKYEALELSLIVDGKRFYINEYSEEGVNAAVESLREINKSTAFFVKKFSVVFDEGLPTGIIEKWEKGKGFSIWYAPAQKEVK